MNITRIAIENSRTTLVILFALMASGIQAYMDMPRAYDPGFIIRTAQVLTYFPGASPERVEELVTDRIEKVVQEIPELDFVKSESRTGVSIVLVNIKESYTDMRPIWDSLRRKIDKVEAEMPDGVIGPNVNDEFGDVFGVVMTITGEGFSYAELKQVADEVRDELLLIGEVAKVDIYGVQQERIFVDYSNARLAELNISPSQLSQSLASTNIVISGGAVNLGRTRIEIEPTGNFESIDDIRRTIVRVPGSDEVVYLRDIADVTRGYIDPPASRVHSSGAPALGLAVSMREGGNNILLGEAVERTVDRLRAVYPIGIEFDFTSFSPLEVENKVDDFVSNLLQAVAVVALVMLISLGLRTGLVVASLIPMSMVMAIFIMSLFGIGLDQISLAALIIALGMLVDNGIVMSENIMVQMQSGSEPMDAAVSSAMELRVPLLTSSLTTAAAFLPIFLAESATGEFTASLFKVVTITLLSSWIISLTVIPLLCVLFLRVKQQRTDYDSRFYRGYRKLLQRMLAMKYLVIAGLVVLFFVSMQGMKYVPKIFFPPSDRLYFTMELELPPGTSIYHTESVVQDVENYIQRELVVNDSRPSGITNWISHIGSGGPRFVLSHNARANSPDYALMVINVTSAGIIDELMMQLDAWSFENFPDLRVTLKRIENGPSIKNPIEVRILGKQSDELYRIVDSVKARMAQADGLRNINDDWGSRIKKLVVDIKPARALRAGVTNQDIAISLQTGMSGLDLTEYREGSDAIPVTLRSSRSDEHDISRLQALEVFAQSTGDSVPLRQVASIDLEWQVSKILRRDRLKTITVGAQTDEGVTAVQGFEELLPWLEQQQAGWPPGYRFELGGEMESSGKANQSIAEKLPVAVFIILVLLVGQFNSIRKPVIVLSAIPLAMIGVVVGLLVARSFFGFMTLLGVISLAGIVINNAIVLLERIKTELDSGLAPDIAIIEAAQRRLRPILLTTATTVLGLIPLYLGGGEMWEPMAVTIIAGLLFSTVLTLGAVPVLYAVLYRIKPGARK